MINITFFIVDVHNTIEPKLTQSILLWFFICHPFNLDHQLSCEAFKKYRLPAWPLLVLVLQISKRDCLSLLRVSCVYV